ncbi:MAG: hypothetical protein ACQES5_06470 [Thermodesulfobacteriota bacterium]
MTRDFEAVRHRAKQLARSCRLPFYEVFTREISRSREIFFNNPLLSRLREDILPFIQTGYSHGIEHCKTVSIEAGALILIEGEYFQLQQKKRLSLIAQCAGLLHDICRLEADHAQKGAVLSRNILQDYPLKQSEIEAIAFAVQNHEAFGPPLKPPSEEAALVSDCLYDADKFRWGPDNFNTTLWEICDFNEWDMCRLIQIFPRGLKKIDQIKETFRTQTGQLHGPGFINCGLQVGKEIYQMMLEAQHQN